LLKVLRKLIPVFSIRLAITQKMSGHTVDVLGDNTAFDLIIVEHIDFLPIAWDIKKNSL
jgi:hypothetical protein